MKKRYYDEVEAEVNEIPVACVPPPQPFTPAPPTSKP